MNALKSIFASSLLALAMAGSAFAAGKVDINKASASELAAALNGIGPSKAEAIVAYRTENGPFKSIEQLAQVSGVGLKTVEKNRDVIEVSSAKPAAASSQPAAQH